MKIVTIMAALLLSSTAFATHPPQNNQPDPSATAVGVGVGIAAASSKASSNASAKAESNNANFNHNTNIAKGGHASANAEGGTSSAAVGDVTANGGSANNNGNAQTTNINQSYEAVRNAPSVALGGVYPTAGCQAGFGIGGSGVNGSGLINFSFTKKECETVVLAQNFAAIGMPDVSCKVLMTTKAWKRAAAKDDTLTALCAPKPAPAAPVAAAPAPVQIVPVDTSQFVKREELAERDSRIIKAVTSK